MMELDKVIFPIWMRKILFLNKPNPFAIKTIIFQCIVIISSIVILVINIFTVSVALRGRIVYFYGIILLLDKNTPMKRKRRENNSEYQEGSMPGTCDDAIGIYTSEYPR